MNILIQAFLKSYKKKVNGDCSVSFNLVDVEERDLVTLEENKESYGWFLFSKSEIQPADVPDEPVNINTKKSYSQRLRENIYFRCREANELEDGDELDKEVFDAYYKERMEYLIKHFNKPLKK